MATLIFDRDAQGEGLATLIERLFTHHPPIHLPEGARKRPDFKSDDGPPDQKRKAAQKMVSKLAFCV